MKHSVRLILLLIIMVLFSCSNEPLIESEMLDQSVESKSATKKSTVSIMEKPDGPDGAFLPITGASSTIHRNNKGITVNFKTNGLILNNAYTMWLVVFGDAPGPPTQISYAAGHIAGGGGEVGFSARLNIGADFNNPLTAEVHVALRSHGPAVPGIIPDQIHTFDTGCDPDLTLPEGPGLIWPDSNEVGYCANIQVAVHPAN